MRTSHRKSRHGCRQCKQRHKKCDETVPACLNCSITNRDCSFRYSRPSSNLPRRGTPSTPPSYSTSPISPAPSSDLSMVFSQPEPQIWHAQVYSLGHMELIHHFQAERGATAFNATNLLLLPTAMCNTVMHSAISSPFILDQVLAISATHMSTLRQDQQQFYRTQAIQLQTRALSQFNSINKQFLHQNYRPWFIFALLLGFHTMYETLQCDDFEALLCQLSPYLSIQRGVRAIAHEEWQLIQDIVAQVVGARSFSEPVDVNKDKPRECKNLYDLIDAHVLDQGHRAACVEAIESLQWSFDLYHVEPTVHTRVHFAIAWPINIRREFAELLSSRMPEALVILAYYGVLLHRLRSFWVFGDSGRFLIRSISQYLDPSWAKWLAWANEQLEIDVDNIDVTDSEGEAGYN